MIIVFDFIITYRTTENNMFNQNAVGIITLGTIYAVHAIQNHLKEYREEEKKQLEKVSNAYTEYCFNQEKTSTLSTLEEEDVTQMLPRFFQLAQEKDIVVPLLYKSFEPEEASKNWLKHVKKGELSPIISEMLAYICQYQTERGSDEIHRYSPLHLCFEEFKFWLVKLSTVDIANEAIKNIVSQRIAYLKTIRNDKVFKNVNYNIFSKTKMEPTPNQTLLVLEKKLNIVMTRIILAISRKSSREHLADLKVHIESVLYTGVDFLFHIFSNQALPANFILTEIKSPTIPSYRKIHETLYCKILRGVVNTSAYSLVFNLESFESKEAIIPTKDLSINDNNSFTIQNIDLDNNFELPVEVKEELNKKNRSRKERERLLQWFELSSSGIFSAVAELKTMNTFLHLLVSLQKLCLFHKICDNLFELSGEGGNLLIYGMAAEQVKTGLSKFKIVKDEIAKDIRYLYDSATKIQDNADANPNEEISSQLLKNEQSIWDENYTKATKAYTQVIAALKGCENNYEEISNKIKEVNTEEYKLKLMKQLDFFASLVKQFCSLVDDKNQSLSKNLVIEPKNEHLALMNLQTSKDVKNEKNTIQQGRHHDNKYPKNNNTKMIAIEHTRASDSKIKIEVSKINSQEQQEMQKQPIAAIEKGNLESLGASLVAEVYDCNSDKVKYIEEKLGSNATAQQIKVDDKESEKKLKEQIPSSLSQYTTYVELASWYFKHQSAPWRTKYDQRVKQEMNGKEWGNESWCERGNWLLDRWHWKRETVGWKRWWYNQGCWDKTIEEKIFSPSFEAHQKAIETVCLESIAQQKSNDFYLTLLKEALLYGNDALDYIQKDKSSLLNTNEQLKIHAANYGYVCENVDDKGDCFYLATAVQLDRVLALNLKSEELKQLARCLRTFACEYIEQHRDVYEEFFDDSFDFKNQKKDKVWVEDIVITALCYALNVNLVLVRDDSTIPNVKKLPQAVCTLFLGYQVNLHYQSLTPNNTDKNNERQTALHNKLKDKQPEQFKAPITIRTKEELKTTLQNLLSSKLTKVHINQKLYDELTHSTIILGEEKAVQVAIRESLKIKSTEMDKIFPGNYKKENPIKILTQQAPSNISPRSSTFKPQNINIEQITKDNTNKQTNETSPGQQFGT